MKKQLFFDVLVCLFGASIGGLVTQKLLDNFYESLIDNEIEKAKEYYKTLSENKDQVLREEKNTDTKEWFEKYQKDHLAIDPKILEEIDKYIEDNLEEDDETSIEEVEIGIGYPYVITEEEYSSDCLHYDKISAVYYSDGTLTDEDETILDIESTIGFDALDAFAYNNGTEPIYVRNENLNIDYMVTQSNFSYSEYILGEEEKNFIKQKRNKEWID